MQLFGSIFSTMLLDALLAWLKFVKFGIHSVTGLAESARRFAHDWASTFAALTAPGNAVSLRDDFDGDEGPICVALFLLLLLVFFAGFIVGRLSSPWTNEGGARAHQLAGRGTAWDVTPSRTATPPARLRSQSSPSLAQTSDLPASCNRRLEFPVPLRSPRVAP